LTNFSFNVMLVFFILNYLFLVAAEPIFFHKYVYKSDFFFTLLNLTILLPLIFFINTLFTFFFLIELNSALIFFKFVNSTSFFYKKKQTNFSDIPKYYINMLFFQYWAAFFSSILFVYVIIFYLYLFNTTEWVLLNFLNIIQSGVLQESCLVLTLINFILILAFLVKIGLTPIHLYKLEIYKGLPYISIFFYTTFYFLVFFLFFVNLLISYVGVFSHLYWYFFILFILVGIFYTINLMFNVTLIKIFFAYSTIINSLGFLCGGFAIVGL
jgi:hypothetical protein